MNHGRVFKLAIAWATAGLAVALLWGGIGGHEANAVSLKGAPGARLTASGPTITLAGPDTASLHEIITYTIHFTVSGSGLGIEYFYPPGFSILHTDPVTSSATAGVLRWSADKLSGRSVFTVSGQQGVGGCSPVIHTAGFFDPYNTQLPTSSKMTVITDLRCDLLPLILKGASP